MPVGWLFTRLSSFFVLLGEVHAGSACLPARFLFASGNAFRRRPPCRPAFRVRCPIRFFWSAKMPGGGVLIANAGLLP